MRKGFLLLTSVFLCRFLSAQIIVSITTPVNLIDTTSVTVRATVTPGEYELTSVVATIANRSVSMINIGPYFQGVLSTSGLIVENTYALTVTATDAIGNQGSAVKNVIVDPLPKLSVLLPVTYEVATPKMNIKASVNDNSDCSIIVRVGLNDNANSWYDRQAYVDTFINAVDTTIDLSLPWVQGTYGTISFTAVDSRGQQMISSKSIFVETSPYLERVFATEGVINDFNYGRLLSYSDGPRNGKIADIHTGIISEIPSTVSAYSGLTPTGAVFMSTSDLGGVVAEWSNDSLYTIGPSGETSSFDVAGPYAIWSEGFSGRTLNMRNTATHTTTLISSEAANSENSVAANGTIAYWGNATGTYNIYRYANGTSVRITTGVGEYPLTDGKFIVYQGNAGIYLYDGAAFTMLSSSMASHYDSYRVTNGFVAYVKPGLSNQSQVWLRDTTGTSTQLTFFSNSSALETLAPDGSLTFFRTVNSQYSRYLYDKNRNKFKMITVTGVGAKSYYRDSAWYVSIGRVLFKVTPGFITKYYSVKDGNWSDPTTWYGNVVPSADADVIIQNNITVDVNATCNSVTVNTGANLALNNGISLTVVH